MTCGARMDCGCGCCRDGSCGQCDCCRDKCHHHKWKAGAGTTAMSIIGTTGFGLAAAEFLKRGGLGGIFGCDGYGHGRRADAAIEAALLAQNTKLESELYTERQLKCCREEQREALERANHGHAGEMKCVIDQLVELRCKAAADAVEDKCMQKQICCLEKQVECLDRKVDCLEKQECELKTCMAVEKQYTTDTFRSLWEEIRETDRFVHSFTETDIPARRIKHDCVREQYVPVHEHYVPMRCPEMQVEAHQCRCDGKHEGDHAFGVVEAMIKAGWAPPKCDDDKRPGKRD